MNDTNSIPIIQQTRFIELDAIRGLAAIAVLMCHLPRGFWYGETGVDLFFVLSGFLISTIILRSVEHPRLFRTFYLRRSLRIFPIYYLAVFVAWLLNAVRHHPQAIDGLPYYLVYLQEIHAYWGKSPPPVDISLAHTWTLAIEEQFYLLWPLTLWLFLGRKVFWLCLILVVMPFILRTVGLSRIVLFGHTDGLALGCLLAWLYRQPLFDPHKWGVRFWVLFIGAALIYWTYWFTFSGAGHTGKKFIENNYAISLINVAYFGLIGGVVCQSGATWLKILRNKWLCTIGTVSYGLYLYHWIIYEKLDTLVKFRWGLGDPLWLDVIKVVLSVMVAFISWHFIEKPILKLKDRFAY